MTTALEQLRTRPWRAATLAALALSAYLFLSVVLPRATALVQTARAAAQEEAEAAAAATWQVTLVEERRTQATLRERLLTTYGSGARYAATSSVLRAVQLAADTAGVALVLLRPLDRSARGAYDEQPVEVKFTGDYHAAGRFAAAVERAGSRVQRLHLQAADGQSALLGEMLLVLVVSSREAVP